MRGAEAARQVAAAVREALSPRALRVLGALLRHLRAVAAEAAANRMDAGNLAKCFWPSVCHGLSINSLTELPTFVRLEHVLALLIEHADALFPAPAGDPRRSD